MKMAEFVETQRGGKALHFEGYAYSKIRDGKERLASSTTVEVVLKEPLHDHKRRGESKTCLLNSILEQCLLMIA